MTRWPCSSTCQASKALAMAGSYSRNCSDRPTGGELLAVWCDRGTFGAWRETPPWQACSRVRPATTFEETVERLGTAIRLGLLPPGTRLPPERELAELFAIPRSTLRQALTALPQTGDLVALRGRTGATFVAAEPPLRGPGVALDGQWRDLLDHR